MKRPVGPWLCYLAVAFGIGGIAYRPFLLAPIGFIVLLVGAKMTPDRRVANTAALLLALCAFAGAAVAAGFSKPLY